MPLVMVGGRGGLPRLMLHLPWPVAVGWWLLRALACMVVAAVRAWRVTLAGFGLLFLWSCLGGRGLLLMVLVLLVVAGVWSRLHRASFTRYLWLPLQGVRRRAGYRRQWQHVMG